MRILYTITSYLPAIGGAQLHAHQIVRRLAYRHDVQVVTQWNENRADWLLGTTIKAPREAKSYSIDGVPIDLIALTARERMTMLPYVLGYYAFKGPAIDVISDILKRKLEPFGDRADIIHNSRIGREGLSYASLKLARKLNVPFVLVPNHHPRWAGWNYKHYVELYRRADAVIALTNSERDKLADLGVHEDRIHVTGIGPILADDGDGERFRTRHRLIEGQPMILFLGQKFKYKGLQAVLQATKLVWKRFPSASFVFIGPRTRFSNRLFAGIDNQRIIEIGSVDLQEKTDALAACTLLCVPSSQESFGGVYTEAWMMGKPVIGGNIPAIRDVITEGVDGYLVSQDPNQIAERICYLLANPGARDSLAKNGKTKVVENYTWDKLSKKTEYLYQHLLR